MDDKTKEYPLWTEEIPYNSNRKKAEDMCLTNTIEALVMPNWAMAIFGTRLCKDSHNLDDYIYRTQILKGIVSDTYDDVPTITPYIVPDSKTSVVIAPGGGFCMLSTENEGVHPAEMLNKIGVSAFVVKYRLAPYRWPLPALDIQRAVRWVRAHAKDYGVKAESVGVMGFSAGGYAVASAAAFLGNDPVAAEGYRPDGIDEENGRPDYLITVYPVTHFEDNPNMLANLKGPEVYTDPEKREAWTKEYSLIEHFDRIQDLPQFMNYGTKDMLKGHEIYARKVADASPHNRVNVSKGALHGYSGEEKWSAWEEDLCDWILSEVCHINR